MEFWNDLCMKFLVLSVGCWELFSFLSHSIGFQKEAAMRINILFVTVFLILQTIAFGYDCVSNTYQDSITENTSKTFLAGDKIYVKISCKKLLPGEYSLVINWDKYNRGTIRTDKSKFVIKHTADREVYFWMKIGEKGFGNRFFSLSDYNTDLIGRWTARPYLNNEQVNESNFTID